MNDPLQHPLITGYLASVQVKQDRDDALVIALTAIGTFPVPAWKTREREPEVSKYKNKQHDIKDRHSLIAALLDEKGAEL